MNNRAIMISVGVGAIVLIWVVFFLPSSKEEARHEPTLVDDDAPAPTPQLDALPPAAAPSPSAAAPEVALAPEPDPSAQDEAAAPQKPYMEQRPEKMGPFEELAASYAQDARDPEAGATEERIRALLKQPDIPEGMLRQVSCVKSVCKLELRWSASDKPAYMVLMMALVSNISQKLAAAPVGDDEGQPLHPIDVYVSRVEPPLTPGAAN